MPEPTIPPSVEYGYRKAWSTDLSMPKGLAYERSGWSTAEEMYQGYSPRHEQYVYHLVTNKALTSNGVAWSTLGGSKTTSTGSSKSSMIVTGYNSTLSWPGLEGFHINELECGLTIGALGGGTTNTTAGFAWEAKDNDETTWTQLTTYKTLLSGSSTKVEFTVSGYGKLGAGYNKLPLGIRLRGYRRGDAGSTAIAFSVKSSSYIAVKAKKSS